MRDPSQHLVAGAVAVAVVDEFEIVDVHYEQRDPVRSGPFEGRVHHLVETVAVEETGQRIVAIKVPVAALRILQPVLRLASHELLEERDGEDGHIE